ncbi:MAG: hypothetical protein F6K19_12085 [Cyanothece sp. SIO1E1]|nr:hypothetical protein [Cyanothece sp. SIO1E1]
MHTQTNLTKLDLLLQVLDDGKWHSSEELASKVSWRFGATIHEARHKGHPIEKRKVCHNHYEYRLSPN